MQGHITACVARCQTRAKGGWCVCVCACVLTSTADLSLSSNRLLWASTTKSCRWCHQLVVKAPLDWLTWVFFTPGDKHGVVINKKWANSVLLPKLARGNMNQKCCFVYAFRFLCIIKQQNNSYTVIMSIFNLWQDTCQAKTVFKLFKILQPLVQPPGAYINQTHK